MNGQVKDTRVGQLVGHDGRRAEIVFAQEPPADRVLLRYLDTGEHGWVDNEDLGAAPAVPDHIAALAPEVGRLISNPRAVFGDS